MVWEKGHLGENDFRSYGSGLRICHWHGDNNDHRADHVIKTLLPCIHRGFISASDNPIRFVGLRGFAVVEVAMQRPLLIFLTVIVLLAVSALAIMNNACKSSQHEWCAPMSAIGHHIKTRNS